MQMNRKNPWPRGTLRSDLVMWVFLVAIWSFNYARRNELAIAPELPVRAQTLPKASQLLRPLVGMNQEEREAFVIDQAEKGNVPEFLRTLAPIVFSSADEHTVVVFVMKDYFSLGSDTDFIRMPLSLPSALRVGDILGMELPTQAIVDAVYQQAPQPLDPTPLRPTSEMTSVTAFYRHNQAIERQVKGPLRELVAGHKKDVLRPEIEDDERVTIYGWHLESGRPIQPISRVHAASYADYSHGVRYVAKTALLDGRSVALEQVLPYLKTDQHRRVFLEHLTLL